MGLRGILPSKHLTQPDRLDDLAPPDWLDDLGKEHWSIHAEYMSDQMLLTTQTAQAFALVCDLYARIRQAETHKERIDCLKAYSQLAKLFRLVPVDKPGAPVQGRFDDKDEFVF